MMESRNGSSFRASSRLVGVCLLATLSTCVAQGEQPKLHAARAPHLPLVRVADLELPGRAKRFDYQDVDVAENHLVVAHMGDDSVLVLRLSDGTVEKVLGNVTTPRGVAIGDNVGRIFVTSLPSSLVIIDNKTLTELGRVPTGSAPDGVAYDAQDRVVGVSDQGDGALSLIAGAGNGKRIQVRLGSETGNVVFDSARHCFWITVAASHGVDQLIGVEPLAGIVTLRIALPGCRGAHGLRIHPNGLGAFVACEDNAVLARVDLGGAHAVVTAATGANPDVMALDSSLGWLYVAAESGDLVVFDITRPGLTAIDREHPFDHAHSVAVDVATHRVFFPLEVGPSGKPVLRIMHPQ